MNKFLKLEKKISFMCFFNIRLDKAIKNFCKLYSRNYLKKCILSNQVLVNNLIINFPDKKIHFGDLITINFLEFEKNEFKDKNIFLDIIYEDEYFLILNKQSNMVVHPGAGNKNGTILNALLHKNQIFETIPRAGIVHRLDKDTTGLMVIAKTIMVYYKLKKLLKLRNIYREYEAIVQGTMISGGTVKAAISRNIYKRTKMSINKNGKPATTYYKIIQRFANFTHIKVILNSGRTHQIRVHMSYIKYPLIGDHIYGKKNFFIKDLNPILSKIIKEFPRQALHARKLSFIHPIKNILMSWYVKSPKDINNLVQNLKLFNKKNI
ncbi:23S rRNA pseudouridine(1911/1915/1917) synthase RluD [Buchnera aphidicola]|uniref:23S rRNA pseudouridine(1911/1915/1917) synthase RluD n=1 Tax=Buchnera aphidicola TaxID=9 RepID=UPI0034641CFE